MLSYADMMLLCVKINSKIYFFCLILTRRKEKFEILPLIRGNRTRRQQKNKLWFLHRQHDRQALERRTSFEVQGVISDSAARTWNKARTEEKCGVKGEGTNVLKNPPPAAVKIGQFVHFCVSSSRLRFVQWACKGNKRHLSTRRECFTQILIHSHVVKVTDSSVHHVCASALMMAAARGCMHSGCPSIIRPFLRSRILQEYLEGISLQQAHKHLLRLKDELV